MTAKATDHAASASGRTLLVARAAQQSRPAAVGHQASVFDRLAMALRLDPLVNAPRLSLARALLDAGQPARAADCARRALTVQPDSAVALTLLGAACARLNRAPAAIAFLRAAVRVQPDHAEAHVLLGSVLEGVGRVADGMAHYRQATRLRPRDTVAWICLGNASLRLGRPQNAVSCYREALTRNAGEAEAWANMASAMQMLGRLADALACYGEALRLRPDAIDWCNNLGVLLRAMGDAGRARRCFRRVLALDPAHAPALTNLGLVEGEAGQPILAVRWYRRALVRAPGLPEAWNNLGNSLKAAGRRAEAMAAWRAALALAPAQPDALGNVAAEHRDAERFAEAQAFATRALRLAPGNAALHGIMAYVLVGQGRIEEARRACRRSLALHPSLADSLCTMGLVEQRAGCAVTAARWFGRTVAVAPRHPLGRFNQGLLRLETGKLRTGWTGYAARFIAGRAGRERRFAIPEWRGEPLAGKRLFIWREQGVGDELLFASCYADAIRMAGAVVIECERRLVPLFARSFPRAVVRAEQPMRGRSEPERVDCDYHIAAGSLPGVLRPQLSCFPPRSSWLFPDGADVTDWRDRLEGFGPGLRVGISWRSQVMTLERSWSYLPLDAWGPVLTAPGVHLVNLQYDDAASEIRRAEARFGARIHSVAGLDLKNDFERTAALVASLDLVIAPANSVAELAGALGVPVWRFGHRDWTQLGTEVRPWYPSMRLFSPMAGAPLSSVLERIVAALARIPQQQEEVLPDPKKATRARSRRAKRLT